MAVNGVRNFVTEYSGELVIILDDVEQTRVNADPVSRHHESVHLI